MLSIRVYSYRIEIYISRILMICIDFGKIHEKVTRIRHFFERTKFKLAGSFFVVMAGFMMLGYCAISGKFHEARR